MKSQVSVAMVSFTVAKLVVNHSDKTVGSASLYGNQTADGQLGRRGQFISVQSNPDGHACSSGVALRAVELPMP